MNYKRITDSLDFYPIRDRLKGLAEQVDPDFHVHISPSARKWHHKYGFIEIDLEKWSDSPELLKKYAVLLIKNGYNSIYQDDYKGSPVVLVKTNPDPAYSADETMKRFMQGISTGSVPKTKEWSEFIESNKQYWENIATLLGVNFELNETDERYYWKIN